MILKGFLAQYPLAQPPKAQPPKAQTLEAQARAQSADLPSLRLFLAQNAAPQIPKTQGRGYRKGKLNSDRLVVLRMGLGRDSMTMLVLLAQGKLLIEGKPRGPDEIDAMVFTDPGHEWEFTYDLIPRVQKFCDRYGIRFLVQSKPKKEGKDGWFSWMQHQIAERERAKRQGREVTTFGTPPWRKNPPASIEERCASGYYHDRIPLFDDYAAKEAWIAKDDSTCTINHKIKPNRELLVDLMEERFGPQDYGTLKARLPYTRQGQSWGNRVRAGRADGSNTPRPHLMLIGYAADEQKRLVEARKAEKKSGKKGWTLDFDTEAYPLMDMNITKAGETPYLEGLLGVGPDGKFRNGGFSDVKKSGCRSCIHQDAAQWWMLRHLDPDYFEERVKHQQRVVKRTGPWQAIFPEQFVAFNRTTGKENPRIEASKKKGATIVFARQEVNLKSRKKPKEKIWVRVSHPKEDGPNGERVMAFVFTPVSERVDRWLAEYREKNGRDPEWEEVARKEYRACAIGTPP